MFCGIHPRAISHDWCAHEHMLRDHTFKITTTSPKDQWVTTSETIIIFHLCNLFPFDVQSFINSASTFPNPGIILCMCPANGRWRYNVTSSLIIGWVHTKNDSCNHAFKLEFSTHRGQTKWLPEKMAQILQTTFSNAFLWNQTFLFWFKFHWHFFLRVPLTISQHWFR